MNIRFVPVCALLAILACGQSWAQALIVMAPFGRPEMVMDESGNFSQAVSVYSDADVETFVPDITSRAWITWNAGPFKSTGKYHVYLYSYYKTDKICRSLIPHGQESDPRWNESCGALRYQRRLIEVDTRNKTVAVLNSLLMESDARYNPANQARPAKPAPLATASKEIGGAVSHVTAIITKETK